jgi:hypothetical protein
MADSKKHTTSKNYPKKKRTRTDKTNTFRCGCGGGQSCIVDRRRVGDWVHEDDVFRAAGLPLRKHCIQAYYSEQQNALKLSMSAPQEDEQLSLLDRWCEDSKTSQL